MDAETDRVADVHCALILCAHRLILCIYTAHVPSTVNQLQFAEHIIMIYYSLPAPTCDDTALKELAFTH